jgi:alkanesulfonate monooxygenase SsuD/methylene tetrahydromethanopterin reductase-like flavin-dependent oxidoreductase (luciferase family)
MSATTRADELREAKHPVYSERALRLGTFGQNLQQGCAITSIDGALEATWPQTLEVAQMGDRMGFEALVSVGRWRGFGGTTDFNGAGFEPFTWASGIGASTSQAGVFSTSHVPTIHPILAAKQAMTIDHITNGRFALNVVTGWHQAEIEMFGAPLLPHDERYEVAREWLHIIRTMWTSEEPFDFEGRYYKVEGAVCRPHPIQRPHPVVMNAGGSEAGRHFGAKECDVVFALTGDHSPAALKAQVDAFRDLARTEYDREISVWCNAYIVQGDTEQDAKDYLRSYVYDYGDWDAVENLVTTFGIQSQSLPPEVARAMKEHFIGGWGGIPIVGTAEQIVDGLSGLVDVGFDGILLSWARYVQDMRRFEDEVHPLLVEAGLR